MKLLLLKAKVRNKLAMPMSTDSLKDIADYFDKHGDSNERILAYYIQCCPKDLLTFYYNCQYNRYLYTII